MKIELVGNKWTGERLETFINSRDTVDHLHRYAIVNDYIKEKIVLDIACGDGYGSNLMSDKASFVYGVDIDSRIIANAEVKYKRSNIKFKVGSTDNIPLEDASIDVIVSFETIEHHDRHHEMMTEIKRVLKSNGLLILSTPNKLYYSDLRNFKNEFHKKELYKKELLALTSKYFKKRQLLNQKFVNGNSIIQTDEDNCNDKIYRGDFLKIEVIEVPPLYLITILSDIKFKKQNLSIFDGSKIIEDKILKITENIYQSNTYKVGNFILLPLKFLKRLLK